MRNLRSNMFEIKYKILSLTFTHYRKLKQKIWDISPLFLFALFIPARCILGLSVFMLLTQGKAYAIALVERPPSKSIVLKLPNNGHANWKEVARSVTKKEGIVERIPLDQTPQNWSELISIQYSEKSKSDSLESILGRMRDRTFATYADKRGTWQVIENNQQDCIYEWILHEPHEDGPPYHEIVRMFTTEFGIHRIGFTRQNAEIDTDEREKWIQLFKKSTSLVSFEDAASASDGLSMADKFKDSLNLGPIFQDWQVHHTYSMDNGWTQNCRIPSSQDGYYITECLEVTTMPVLDTNSVDQLFTIEKDQVRKDCMRNVKFHILKKTPNEIIYYYSHPKDLLQLTGVVRTVFSHRGYYSITYKRGLEAEMKKADILQWAKQLQRIEVVDKALPKT
jgi:hypothetical protein